MRVSAVVIFLALGLSVVLDAVVPFPTTAPGPPTGAWVVGKGQQHSNGYPPGPNSGSSSGRMRFSENRDVGSSPTPETNMIEGRLEVGQQALNLSTEVRVLPLEPIAARGGHNGLDLLVGQSARMDVNNGMERRTLDADAGVVRRIRQGADIVTAVTGTLTYYHPDLAGNVMRDGITTYEPTMSGVAAATSWPLGTWLEVRGPTGRSLLLVISDTGKLEPGALDVPEAVFVVLAGSLAPGRVPVRVRVID